MLARLGGGGGVFAPAEFAAAADLDLRLDRARVADAVGRSHRLVDGARRLAPGNGDAVPVKERLSLIFEEVHQPARTLLDVHTSWLNALRSAKKAPSMPLPSKTT